MDWVPLVTAPDTAMAEMWAELLCNRGVPAMVDHPDGSFPYPMLQMSSTVLVPQSRLEEARRFLGPAIVGRRYHRRK